MEAQMNQAPTREEIQVYLLLKKILKSSPPQKLLFFCAQL
jgi:hypothetical protein